MPDAGCWRAEPRTLPEGAAPRLWDRETGEKSLEVISLADAAEAAAELGLGRAGRAEEEQVLAAEGGEEEEADLRTGRGPDRGELIDQGRDQEAAAIRGVCGAERDQQPASCTVGRLKQCNNGTAGRARDGMSKHLCVALNEACRDQVHSVLDLSCEVAGARNGFPSDAAIRAPLRSAGEGSGRGVLEWGKLASPSRKQGPDGRAADAPRARRSVGARCQRPA